MKVYSNYNGLRFLGSTKQDYKGNFVRMAEVREPMVVAFNAMPVPETFSTKDFEIKKVMSQEWYHPEHAIIIEDEKDIDKFFKGRLY